MRATDTNTDTIEYVSHKPTYMILHRDDFQSMADGYHLNMFDDILKTLFPQMRGVQAEKTNSIYITINNASCESD